jgi:hypothetical protein
VTTMPLRRTENRPACWAAAYPANEHRFHPRAQPTATHSPNPDRGRTCRSGHDRVDETARQKGAALLVAARSDLSRRRPAARIDSVNLHVTRPITRVQDPCPDRHMPQLRRCATRRFHRKDLRLIARNRRSKHQPRGSHSSSASTRDNARRFGSRTGGRCKRDQQQPEQRDDPKPDDPDPERSKPPHHTADRSITNVDHPRSHQIGTLLSVRHLPRGSFGCHRQVKRTFAGDSFRFRSGSSSRQCLLALIAFADRR